MVMLNNKKIRNLRLALGLTAADFAAKLDVSEACIWKWEKGIGHPTWEKMQRLNAILKEAEKTGISTLVMMNGAQIKELRLSLGLTGAEFATKLGVSEDCVWKWEKGIRHPTWKKMQRLNDLLKDAEKKGLLQLA